MNFRSVVVAKEHNALLLYAIDEAAVRVRPVIGLPLANARAICPEMTVYDADRARRSQDAGRHRRLVRPLHAAGGARSAAWAVSRHTGCAHLFGGEAALLRMVCGALTPQGFAVSAAIAGTSICARTLTRSTPGTIVADGEEAEAVCSAAGICPRRRRRHHKRPAPRGAENHRRCRLARAARNIGAVRRPLHHFAGAGAGRGRCADQPAKTAAGLHRRKTLCRTDRDRSRDLDDARRASPRCWSRRWTSRARARGGWRRAFSAPTARCARLPSIPGGR